jgi:hypothetical protein
MMRVGALLHYIRINFKHSFDCVDHEIFPPRDDGRFAKIVGRNTPERQPHTSPTSKAAYSIPTAAKPTPATTPKIGAILSPGAAAELAIATDDEVLVAVDSMELDVMFELIIEVFTAELAVTDDVLLDNTVVPDIIVVSVSLVEDIVVLDAFTEDITADMVVPDIMVLVAALFASWFEDGMTKPPMPAAARALRVENIMAMLRMLDFDLNECPMVKS